MGNKKNRRKNVRASTSSAPTLEEVATIIDRDVGNEASDLEEPNMEPDNDSIAHKAARRNYQRVWQRNYRIKINQRFQDVERDVGQRAVDVIEHIRGSKRRRTSSSSIEQFHKYTTSSAKSLAALTVEYLKNCEPDVQKSIFEKYLSHKEMQTIVPNYLSDLNRVKNNQTLVENLKSGLTQHLTGNRASPLIMVKDIVCTLASSDNTISNRSVASLLGVDRRNIKKAIERRLQLDNGSAFWLNSSRATRCDALTVEVKQLVIQFWTTETTISPQIKDVHKRIGVKKFEVHVVHYLQTSQLEFFTSFKEHHPDAAVQLTKFQILKLGLYGA